VYQAQRDFLSDKIRSQLDLHAKVQRRPCGEAAVMEVVRSHSLDGEKIFWDGKNCLFANVEKEVAIVVVELPSHSLADRSARHQPINGR